MTKPLAVQNFNIIRQSGNSLLHSKLTLSPETHESTKCRIIIVGSLGRIRRFILDMSVILDISYSEVRVSFLTLRVSYPTFHTLACILYDVYTQMNVRFKDCLQFATNCSPDLPYHIGSIIIPGHITK